LPSGPKRASNHTSNGHHEILIIRFATMSESYACEKFRTLCQSEFCVRSPTRNDLTKTTLQHIKSGFEAPSYLGLGIKTSIDWVTPSKAPSFLA